MDNILDNRLKIEEPERDLIINKMNEEQDKTPLAFVIDFSDGKSIDNQRYKNMVERFQSRHKRGQSLSQIDDNNFNKKITPTSSSASSSKSRPPMSGKLPRKKPITTNSESSFSSEHDDMSLKGFGNVKLREKSLTIQREGSKRHSWSPRSSAVYEPQQHQQHQPSIIQKQNSSDVRGNFIPRSKTLALALKSPNKIEIKNELIQCSAPPLDNYKCSDEESVSEAGTYTLDGDNYTEEQKEKMNIDKLTKKAKLNKLMIKKNKQTNFIEDKLEIIDLDDDENLINSNTEKILNDTNEKKTNILEISCYHNEQINVKPKISYLDKIKSRVKNIGERTFNKGKSPDKIEQQGTIIKPDMGTFTSVSTSGILSVKPTLDQYTDNIKLKRKNSLTKSQIDASEYVEGISRLNLNHLIDNRDIGNNEQNDHNVENKILNCYTDVEKSNLKEKCTIIQKKNIHTNNNNNNNNNNLCTNLTKSQTNIKSAATKNDWIQEWALVAREYSKSPRKTVNTSRTSSINSSTSNNSPQLQTTGKKHQQPQQQQHQQHQQQQMSRSYDFDNHHQYNDDFDMTRSDYYDQNYEEFGHNLERNNYRKNLNRFRTHNIGEFEYSSDPNLKYLNTTTPTTIVGGSGRNNRIIKQQQQLMNEGNYYNQYNERIQPKWSNINNNNNNNNNKQNYLVRDYEANLNQLYGGNISGGISGSSESVNNRPPMSPSKIPSPIHSISKARGTSRTRSQHGSVQDLTSNDTEMYLQKTAAAITSLQNIHRQNSLQNSPQSPSSPINNKLSPKKISPIHSVRSPIHQYSDNYDELLYYNNIKTGRFNQYQQQQNYQNKHEQQQIHKRNLSLDGTEIHPKLRYQQKIMSNSLNTDGLNAVLDLKQHQRHHSYDGILSLPPKPLKQYEQIYRYNIDNTYQQQPQQQQARNNEMVTMRPVALIKQQTKNINKKGQQQQINNSPIKRSSSFSVKPIQHHQQQQYSQQKTSTSSSFTPKITPKNAKQFNTIQKSASSTSFRKLTNNINNYNNINNDDDENNDNLDDDDDDLEFYINDDDDLDPRHCYSSDSDFSDEEPQQQQTQQEQDKQKEPPLTNTRYNKAFLMRLEQNKKPLIGNAMKQGVVACPNTPELPRRDSHIRTSFRERASMPRDSSLSRMKQDLPNLNTTKKTLAKESIQQPTKNQIGNVKVQPKYLDISKYKPVQGQNFLKRDESKSYLVHKEVRRSPSVTSVNLNRTDPMRVSNRSVKSAGSKSVNAIKKEQLAQKAKEAELALWKRRASYDPMKAAAEGRKKQEEAKKQAHQQQSKLCDNSSAFVLRSQSFHSGVGQTSKIGANSNNDNRNRWTLTSNESSDDDYTINS